MEGLMAIALAAALAVTGYDLLADQPIDDTHEFQLAEQTRAVTQFNGRSFGCDQNKVRIAGYLDKPGSRNITILENENGKKFIVKQKTKDGVAKRLCCVRDMLGAYIAESAGIPANRVTIIPAYHKFPGKKILEWPATLHEFVPGIQANGLPEALRAFNVSIAQSVAKNLSEKEKGLTRETIRVMSAHPDLCMIAAFDCFIACSGRRSNNFFYDVETNRYWAIDLESSFNQNLARYACHLLTTLSADTTETISQQEIRGLMVFRDTLKRLLQLHTPEKICARMMRYAIRAGLIQRTPKRSIGGSLSLYERKIYKNYVSCKKLVSLLDAYITQQSVA